MIDSTNEEFSDSFRSTQGLRWDNILGYLFCASADDNGKEVARQIIRKNCNIYDYKSSNCQQNPFSPLSYKTYVKVEKDCRSSKIM